MAQRRVKRGAPSKLRKESSKVSSSGSVENVEQYIHDYEKRPNNPPVGLVTPETDKEMPRKRYEYDPHLDPQLQWAGKKENASFEVDTVSLHVHERIDPLTIIEKVRKKQKELQQTLFHYFEQPENNPPLREAIDFYKHSQNWSNRLTAGDSLLVMNSLLQKEGMAGKVQMIYMDPPYGIKYGSNFQPFVNKRDVKDGKDEDLSQEPETIKAFRDTWELGIHSYLTYMRDRLLLSKELLSNSGSIFVQISDENVHLIRCLLDDIFQPENFIAQITFIKTSGLSSKFLPSQYDFLLWYGKDKTQTKFHQLYKEKSIDAGTASNYNWLDLGNGHHRGLTRSEKEDLASLPNGARIYKAGDITSQGNPVFPFEHQGKTYRQAWKTNLEGMKNLAKAGRLHIAANTLQYIRYLDDFPYMPVTQLWDDTATGSFTEPKIYAVQTSSKVIERCILMTTEPGDLVLDPTCGSGTTAYVAEKGGRRWMTCDTSRVAITLTKQRLMTATYDYYELKNPSDGVGSGFKYNSVSHITLGSIAHEEKPSEEILYDRPLVDQSKTRICGPFTVEAVPAPTIKSIDLPSTDSLTVDSTSAKSGETTRQDQWRNELLSTGVLGKGGEKITFSRVEPLPGTDWLHADAETRERQPRRIVVSFGPDYAPLEQKQVAMAMEEAQSLIPRPKAVLFAAFQFDPEAAKDIDEMKWEGVALLRIQMNTDLLTEDLKKKVSKSQSFWLMGQPDIELQKQKDGKYVVQIKGFDYYNPKTHEIESGDNSRIAMWMLDTDYDGRSLYPQQVFFPMAGSNEGGWSKVRKSLKTDIDEDLLEKYRGTVSLPLEIGFNRRIAVKIIDDRGIESLRILKVK